VMLSVTNHGEISSRLVLPLLLLVFLIVSLLLMRFELLPLVSICLSPLLFILLFNEFLLFTELDLERLVARTGRRLVDVGCFLPTLDKERVTGWLDENDVSILLSMGCCELSTGSMLASGELVGESASRLSTSESPSSTSSSSSSSAATPAPRTGSSTLSGRKRG